MIRRMLYALDRWVVRHERYRPVGDGGYICHIRIARYRRVPLVLADGTVVNPGDPIVELHLDNLAAAALNQGGKGGLRFRREMLRMMPALAWISQPPRVPRHLRRRRGDCLLEQLAAGGNVGVRVSSAARVHAVVARNLGADTARELSS